MKRYQKSVIATGHEQVSKAAGEILSAGGNAFDAVVAAGFASSLAEPTLTSLGGGGFMLGHDARSGRDVFVDFFVDSPGKGHKANRPEPHFFPVTINFTGASQIFNVGLGSVAVPGTLRGLLHIHERFGCMPIADVLAPARALAKGHTLNEQQAHFIEILYPILSLYPEGKDLFTHGEKLLQKGDCLQNPKLADFLEQIVLEGDDSFYHGEIAAAIAADMASGDGLLTRDDLDGYQVVERKPLAVPYRNRTLLTAPEPSMGGTLIGLSLQLLKSTGKQISDWGTADHLLQMLARLKEVELLRSRGLTTPQALADFIDTGTVGGVASGGREFLRGTTHVSIADSHGNCASMTCSNGESSGYFAPTTGIMLNNMMGEDDLHPDGFHAGPPGERVLSMMSPSMLKVGDDIELVIGSGGSKRIRTAISQVLSMVVDYGFSLGAAIEAPRLYWDEDRVQLEPGFSSTAVQQLEQQAKVHLWTQRDVYFGGVHAVIPGREGVGDPRRGGSVLEVFEPPAI